MDTRANTNAAIPMPIDLSVVVPAHAGPRHRRRARLAGRAPGAGASPVPSRAGSRGPRGASEGYADAERTFRDTFQALSADALKTNNQAFLTLAETPSARSALRQRRSTSTRGRRRSRTSSRRWRRRSNTWTTSSRDAERRRIESGATLLQKIACARHRRPDASATKRGRLTDALKRRASAAAGASCS